MPLAAVAMAGWDCSWHQLRAAEHRRLMFGFIILPITFLGGTYYSWTGLAPVSVGGWHWLQTVVLINPLIWAQNDTYAARSPKPRTCTCT